MNINCIAVDDEPLALDIIEDYVSRIDYLELSGKFTSAKEALKRLKDNKVDVLFLDIQMPELNGFELLESLGHKPNVIFTTAYENYAADSYNFEAVDYLLKPFSFQRFMKAIDKVIRRLAANTNVKGIHSALPDFVFVYSGGELVRINKSDIVMIKGLSDYAVLKTKDKKFIIRENLKKMEEMLSDSGFARVHKSFIVNMSKIESIKSSEIKLSGETVPIGRMYKNLFRTRISSITFGAADKQKTD